MNKLARSYRDLDVYQNVFDFQQRVFEHTKSWPREERFSLTDQIRRSSRSIGANIAEAWAKRRYEAHFISKVTDSDGELQETKHWLDTATACDYLTTDDHGNLNSAAEIIGKQLNRMIAAHESFCHPG